MALSKGQYRDVFRTSYFNVIRTSVENVFRKSVGDIPWCYIEDHIVISIRRCLGTSSGRPQDVILSSEFVYLGHSELSKVFISFVT